MPDDSWNPKGLDIPLRRPFEIFIPNVNAIDMDTTGSWPFGRRPEDQVATRFLSIFLDQANGCGGPCDLETLGRQALWDAAPIQPKTPPNPLANDVPFLDEFPYLAPPHHPPGGGYEGGSEDGADGGYADEGTGTTKIMEPLAPVKPVAPAAPGERLYRLYADALRSGDLDAWQRVWTAVEEELRRSDADELLLYRATVALELHRIDAAEDALGRLGYAAGSSYARQLQADAALQRGRYAEARRLDEALLAEERSWDRLARVAYLDRREGHRDRADRLYAEAQSGLSVKEMETWAWLELQRGLVDLGAGDHAAALRHLDRAGRADAADSRIAEHEAEALVASGRFDEAEAIYRRVVATTGNPEYVAALADVVARRDAAEAAPLYRQADAAFAERYRRFPAAVAAHFADYLLDHRPDDPRLMELAEPTTGAPQRRLPGPPRRRLPRPRRPRPRPRARRRSRSLALAPPPAPTGAPRAALRTLSGPREGRGRGCRRDRRIGGRNLSAGLSRR